MRRTVPALVLACACACAPQRPAASPDAWSAREPSSKRAARLGELALATGLAAGAFGGGAMAAGKAVGGESGEAGFWIGVGTLGVGIAGAAVALVVFVVAGVEYAAGD